MMGFLSGLPVIGGMFDDSEDKAQEQYAKILKMYENMQALDDPYKNYLPEELKYGGDFNPELAQYQQISEDPRLLSDQASYLNQLKKLSQEGLSAEDAAVFDQAQRQAGQQARGAREATMSNMAARGTAGSGLELVSKELANQQAAERARSSMMDQAAASARQKALYTQAYGGELGSQRAANNQVAGQNADIINRFNQLNTGARNTAAYNNIQNRQDVGNQNVASRNSAQAMNLQGAREAKQTAYQNQLDRMKGIANQYQNAGDDYLRQAEANRAKRGAIGSAAGAGIGAMFGGKQGAQLGSYIGGGLG